jgi:hypothetical protein
MLFPTRLAFQHIRLLHQVCYFIAVYRFQTTCLTVSSPKLFMFFSIAVSRVAPVLFPDASDDVSSVYLAQSAAAILEKVKNVDRERTSCTIPFILLFLTLTCYW